MFKSLRGLLDFSWILGETGDGFPSFFPKIKERKEIEFFKFYSKENIFSKVNEEVKWEANSPPL